MNHSPPRKLKHAFEPEKILILHGLHVSQVIASQLSAALQQYSDNEAAQSKLGQPPIPMDCGHGT